MQFNTLQHIPIEVVTNCFNKAFSDYEIPLNFSIEAMQQKIFNEDVDLSLSVGAFDNEQLTGFIFHGVGMVDGKKTMWDGGTGVIPEYRGQQLTPKMYNHILPLLKEHGAKRILLEVLENNIKAKSIYLKLGFTDIRLLHAYRGLLQDPPAITHNVVVTNEYDTDALLALADWQPAWQQMNDRLKNHGASILTAYIKDGEQPVAYIRYNDYTKRIYQFAVGKQYRKQGMGTALFNHVAGDNTTPLSIINVDARDESTNAFLRSLGLEQFLSQYEMELNLD